MLFSLLLAGASVVSAAACRGKGKGKGKGNCDAESFTNLVAFGDSYTDNGRLVHYIVNSGSAPTAGQLHAESNVTASGGLTWVQYAAREAEATLYDYAVSGATCSNNIVARDAAFIGREFPSVLEDEIPSFTADVAFNALYPTRTAANTVYALWIGTNDLGFDAFLSDSQAPGKTITDFVGCVWSVFDAIYQTGGRRFVLLNTAPLELTPLYAKPENGGTYDSQFWGTKTQYNITEYGAKIKQYSTNVNTIFSYGVPVEASIKSRWPGATVDLFDVHSLFLDIIKTPQEFLDAPYNVTGYFRHCQATDNSNCVDQTALGPRSGFLWYDELHPTDKAGKLSSYCVKLANVADEEIADSVIANHFLDVVAGNSKYGARFTSG
ncbi:hypothetical protein OQA88_13027 [Cercophora sp. LCS_1]